MVKFNRVFKVVLCLGIVMLFLGCTGTQQRESTGQYVDDSVITTKVKTAIFKEETLKTLQINVETFKAVVQLSGFVDSLQNVDKAEEVASSVEGVVSVENDLVVKNKNIKSQI
jgi:osmotically-inducible protein OsmY